MVKCKLPLSVAGGKLGNGHDGILVQDSSKNKIGKGNVIAANGADAPAPAGAGIRIIFASDKNEITESLIGVNEKGDMVGNERDGIFIDGQTASDNVIGGLGVGNKISFNGAHGIGAGGVRTKIIDNELRSNTNGPFDDRGIDNVYEKNESSMNGGGATLLGVRPIVRDNLFTGNLGAAITVLTDDSTIIGNTIQGSQGDGVLVSAGVRNVISKNQFIGNSGLGINLFSATDDLFGVTGNDPGDADTGANNLQNSPKLTSISFAGGFTTVGGEIDSSLASSGYPITIEFFSNSAPDPSGFGEGETFLGSMTVSGPGSFVSPSFAGQHNFVTATATDALGNTSEFSNVIGLAAPTVSIDDVSQAEGDSGGTVFTFTARLSHGFSQPVTVQFATQNGGAVAPSDYQHVTGTVTFNPGEITKPIPVTVNGDTTFELGESFFVNLSNPTNATIADGQGVGIIVNDDPDVGVFEISVPRNPHRIIAGPGSYLFFTETVSNRIGRLDTSTSQIAEVIVPTAQSSPLDLALGDDGYIYFTEHLGNKIGKLDPDTMVVVEEFVLPNGTHPNNIAVAQDGDLIFTIASGIGRFDLASETFTTYTISSGGYGFLDVIVAPDGIVWLTQIASTGGAVNRLDLATGNTVQYDLSGASIPSGIAFGPDGNLWVADVLGDNGDSIWRVTTSGVVTEFHTPTAWSGPQHITAAPDGFLYATEYYIGKIVKIDPSDGSMTEINIPTPNNGAFDVTVGPDGQSVWFTEASAKKLGRIGIQVQFMMMMMSGGSQAETGGATSRLAGKAQNDVASENLSALIDVLWKAAEKANGKGIHQNIDQALQPFAEEHSDLLPAEWWSELQEVVDGADFREFLKDNKHDSDFDSFFAALEEELLSA